MNTHLTFKKLQEEYSQGNLSLTSLCQTKFIEVLVPVLVIGTLQDTSSCYDSMQEYYTRYLGYSLSEFEDRWKVLEDDEAELEESLTNYYNAYCQNLPDDELIDYIEDLYCIDIATGKVFEVYTTDQLITYG